MLNAQQRSPRYGEENTVLVKGIAFVVVYWGSGETAAWPSKWLPFILNEGTIRFLEQIDRTQIYAENSPSSREKGCLRWKYETRNDMEVWLMVSGFAEVGLARPIWHLTLNTNVGKKKTLRKKEEVQSGNNASCPFFPFSEQGIRLAGNLPVKSTRLGWPRS